MLLDQSNNQSGGDAFKKYLAEQAKREALKRSQDYLNDKFSESGADFDFAYKAGDKSVKDIFKGVVKKKAKQEALKRSQNYLNEKLPSGTEEEDPRFNFADNPDDRPLKEIFKNNAKKAAKDELKKQGSKLFDRAKEKYPGLGQVADSVYDPENDDESKRFAGIKGTNKEKMKEDLQDYLKKEGREKLQKRIKKGLEEYLKQGGKRTATEEAEHLANTGLKQGVKYGSKKALKSAAKEGVEDVAKIGTKAVVKGGAKLGTTAAVDTGLEAGTEILGAAGAVETFGISEILAQLIVIAISLGISDAIDGAECLLKKDYKEAMHFFVRAGTKIGVFVLFIVSAILFGALLPLIGVVIPLIAIHIYWGLGSVPFLKEMAIMQGLVWWEKIIIVAIDLVLLFYISMAVFVGLYIYCNIGAITGGGAGATVGLGGVGSTIGGIIDSATTEKGSYCQVFQGASSSSGSATNSTPVQP